MGNFNLRRYDTQARVGLWLSLVAVIGLGGTAAGVFRNFSLSDYTTYYGGTLRMAVLSSGMVTLLLAAIALGLGLNSAGQRRNDKATQSWIGFFVGALVFCLTLLLLVFFVKRGQLIVH